MKPLVCEMCGSNEILKTEGVFVCQICGTKYSVEEAKKMMIEGSVDVSGSTVKIDNSSSVKNYLIMANSAYEAKNNLETENYCNRVIEIDANNYEAWFLKGKAAGWQSTLAKLRIDESVQCFSKAIDNAPDDRVDIMKKQAADEITNLSVAMVTLSCNHFYSYPTASSANTVISCATNSLKYALQLISKCGVVPNGLMQNVVGVIDQSVINVWQKITSEYGGPNAHPNRYELDKFQTGCFSCISVLKAAASIDGASASAIPRYQFLITITETLIPACSYKKVYRDGMQLWELDTGLTNEAKEVNINSIMEYHQAIKEINPDYEIPKRPTARQLSKNGCYVATCVYGSYDCPQVWTLRRYRDFQLAETWHGRAFIRTYYAISPTLVKWFGNTSWFKKMWRGKLDRMVMNLQEQGYESSPYKDREW